jgi:hypothetical protein
LSVRGVRVCSPRQSYLSSPSALCSDTNQSISQSMKPSRGSYTPSVKHKTKKQTKKRHGHDGFANYYWQLGQHTLDADCDNVKGPLARNPAKVVGWPHIPCGAAQEMRIKTKTGESESGSCPLLPTPSLSFPPFYFSHLARFFLLPPPFPPTSSLSSSFMIRMAVISSGPAHDFPLGHPFLRIQYPRQAARGITQQHHGIRPSNFLPTSNAREGKKPMP